MKNRKRLLTLALLCMAVAFSVLGLTACGTADNRDPGKSAYEIWLDNGFTGTEQDFLNWLKNQSNNADSLGLSFALTDEDTYSVSVGLATERSVIVIPATYNNKPVTKIANKAFNECTNLKKVTIPDSVTSIGYSAFSGCSSLTSITIGNSVTSIGSWAFSSCSSLTSITIPESVTSIDEHAFSTCTSLSSVTMGNGVTSIGNNAFQYCKSLTSVTIGSGVRSIGCLVLLYCNNLKTIFYKGSKANWQNIEIDSDNINMFDYLYFYSETNPEGAFRAWHYDTDGVTPIKW